ncbi:hypothetical protein U9M48_023183 [Paspalum notatum var. saurae]|uniref:Uncharacterized protein n=1 Tax=Paspalum notatum var. saurae TaxID=547442 RepID=A0AAQ3TL23_PASNO
MLPVLAFLPFLLCTPHRPPNSAAQLSAGVRCCSSSFPPQSASSTLSLSSSASCQQVSVSPLAPLSLSLSLASKEEECQEMAGAVTLAAATSRGLLRRRSCSCSCSALAPLLLLLCASQLLRTSQAFTLLRGDDEKVPQLAAVIVPDPTPELSGLAPAPLAAPPPVFGGGGDDMRPRLPTERWRRRGSGEAAARRAAAHSPAAPTTAPSAGGPARAPAPESGMSGGGAAAIKSSPAVPVPRGVTDTATILPMPAPGEKRQEVGAAGSSSVQQAACSVVPLLLGFIVMMAAF